MLEFDNKKHAVTYAGKSVELQPLSYRLLLALAEQPEHVFSVAELITKVWTNSQVSPETLKQRVFVLRKALDEAGLTSISIQAVRGEGYRLVLAAEPKQSLIQSRPSSTPHSVFSKVNLLNGLHTKRIIYAFLTLSLLSLVVVWYFFSKHNYVINNRVLLWSNLPAQQMPVEASSALESWRSLVAKESASGQLQLVLSDRVEGMLVPVQARRDRAGVISHFEFINTLEGYSARLSIVEPRTATVLRSDEFDLSNPQQVAQVFDAQFSALNNLVSSHRLCLTKEQRDNSQAPIWQELRAIANQS